MQSFDLSVGRAHVFYPERSEDRITVALMLDIDPIDMVRGNRGHAKDDFTLAHYVNDRPYVASSFMSVAISKAFSSALNGNCEKRPELVDVRFPFEVEITALPAPKGGEVLIRKLFEPLGYTVELERHILDKKFPDWGESKYFSVKLTNTLTVKDLLSHLYVLIPTLDNDKHYFVSESEIEKLIKKGEGWLNEHPEKDQIVRRYLINLNSLARKAFERLSDGEATETDDETVADAEVRIRKESLNQRRLDAVVEKLIELGGDSVIDLGCGEGKLVKELLKHKQFSRIGGMDVSYDRLLRTKDRLHFEHMAPRQKERIQLFQGSLTYRDKRLEGFDSAAVVEVIEHLELDRLKAFERVVFEFARPSAVIVTTPNKEYNVMWEKLGAEKMRHDDHRFEWTRHEFAEWANAVCEKFDYRAEILPVGDEDADVGAPAQMAVFRYGN